ncbi:DUF1413 domain-containing protein [Mesobacillus jeotgali]|uniref:DUF1413 domain-containing protein n=1 Tax=Mesobacillus jeotgali TaxID=129985 RepID=UPI000C8649A5|nr:DUF1413 domain-containing protein [Mesobacillus jeotgali]
MSVVIPITLTDSEYKTIVKESSEKGLTPAQYLKHKAVSHTEFEIRYEYLRKTVLKIPSGHVFTVMSIFSDWNSIERGIKLSLGRNFYHLIKRGGLPEIKAYGKNSSNIQLYIKRENKMMDYLGEKYSDNPIVNYLQYFKQGIHESEISLNERWRKENDLDVIWLDGDLNADTIFSVWMPLKMSLQSSKTYPYKMKGNKYYPYKDDAYQGKQGIIHFLSDIISNIDKYLPRNEWEELYQFAELASTISNVIRLPDKGRGMQKRGIIEIVDGKQIIVDSFYDQIPRTLYECFEGGEFRNKYKNREYFKNDKELKDWILDQDLDILFSNGVISRETIKPLIPRLTASESEWLSDKKDILEMLKQFNKILIFRQEKLDSK